LEAKTAQDVRAILSVIAIEKGLRIHGKFLANYSEDEMMDMESRVQKVVGLSPIACRGFVIPGESPPTLPPTSVTVSADPKETFTRWQDSSARVLRVTGADFREQCN
jgi:hypothetical protein